MMPIISKAFGSKLAIQHPLQILVRQCHKKAINVTWEKPEKGWMKLNYDGSCKCKPGSMKFNYDGPCKCKIGRASIGGIFRDHNAGFVLGYAEYIGISNSTIAELAALRKGLEIVLENGWSDVWLEGDCKSLLDIISEGKQVKCEEGKVHVARINMIIPEIKNCVLTHVYREGNKAADRFAQMGHRLKEPQIWRHDPPEQVLNIVNEDAQGKTFLRRR